MCFVRQSLCRQGMKNPLDNVSQLTPRAASKPEDKAKKAATGMYQYFLKVCVCCLFRGRGITNIHRLPVGAVRQDRCQLCCMHGCAEAMAPLLL